MKTLSFLLTVIILIILLSGCSSSSSIKLEDTNTVTLTVFGEDTCWTAVGFAESYNFDSAFEAARVEASTKLMNYLSIPIKSDSETKRVYDAKGWQITKRKIDKINDSFYRVILVITAPVKLNPKQSKEVL